MDCDICLNPYDHSKHKPFSLTCPHTVCLECLNKLNTKYCPHCKEQIKAKYPNLALIKLIPESEYDKIRNKLEKTIIEVNDLKQKLTTECENKLESGLTRFKSLKNEINEKTADLINSIMQHQKKLLEELNTYENSLKYSIKKLKIDSRIENSINEGRNGLEKNLLNEDEMIKLNNDIASNTYILHKMLMEINKLNQVYEFSNRQDNFNELGFFGEIISKKQHTFDEYLQLAEDFISHENFKGAVFFYDKALSIKSNCAEAHNSKGNALFRMKEYKQALDCYDKAIDLKPKGKYFFLIFFD